jgi:hypothetical protein
MKRGIFATGSALGLVFCLGASASAQTSEGMMSVTVVGNWAPNIGGTTHQAGSGTVLGLPVLVDEKQWTDTHQKNGLMGSAGLGIGLNEMVEAVANVEFGRTKAEEIQVGTVATLPLFARFDDLKYWGLNGGARIFLGSGSVSPYVTGTVGFRRVSELGGTFTVPAASVTLPQPFFERSTVPTMGADVGVLFGETRARFGVQVGVRWTGSPNGAAESFAGTGLENLNDEGSNLSMPVGVVIRF